MKIVFDTNVLISAFVTSAGPAQYVLSRALRRHQVFISSYILQEFRKNLIKKFEISPHVVEEACDSLTRRTYLMEPGESSLSIPLKDKKDIPVLGLAHACGANYLVTGDKGLLEVRKYGICAIIRPREAMEFI